MGNCRYCGQSVGLFSHSHQECENKHKVGLAELERVSNAFFNKICSQNDISGKIRETKRFNFIEDEEISAVAHKAISDFTSSISRPFAPSQLNLVRDYVIALGVPYNLINQHGAVDDFAFKLIKGFMVDYFTDNISLSQAIGRCEKVKTTLPVSRLKEEEAYYYVLNKAASNFLSDGYLSDEERDKIDNYVSALSLQINNIPAQFQGGDLEKINQSAILKNLEKGIIPPKPNGLPILLGKSESLLWAFNGVTLYEEKITREWKGRSSGFSFRIVKGVYYRTGGIKGKPVEHSSMVPVGSGALYITNKNLIFHSFVKGLKIPYRKIIGISPYSDGVEIQRDGANAKRLAIQGFDPWFLMNLMSIISE